MAQHDYDIVNGTGAAVRTDINNVLDAVVTQNSGNSAPTTTFSYQKWADTTAGLLKIRNGANNAWVTLGALDTANLGLATLASPILTGSPKAPTPASGNNTTLMATTAFVSTAISNIPALTAAEVNGFAYPVNSIYTSIVATNPATLLGVGTWVAFGGGRVLVGQDASDSDFNVAQETGGAKTDSHALTVAEMPSHVHGYTGIQGNANPDGSTDSTSVGNYGSYPRVTELDYEGGGEAHTHDIVQPYIVVYFWKRTA
jgi:hypothetical protein